MAFNLRSELESVLSSQFQITSPTAVQSESISAILKQDQNVVIEAATGSGKTFAFLLPILQQIAWPSSCGTCSEPNNFRTQKTVAFILAPTKELAQQIFTVLEKLVRSCCNWVVPGLLNGTDKRKSEKARIRKGLNIVVATPGRLLDHLQNTESFSLGNLEWFVLDEADRLLDLGFSKKISEIMQICTKARNKKMRIVCCSATVDEKIQKFLGSIAGTSCKSLVVVKASAATEASNTASKGIGSNKLVQKCVILPVKIRLLALISLMKKYCTSKANFKAICFFSCCDSVDFHYALLKEGRFFEDQDLALFRLHGSLEQRQRTEVFCGFSKASKGLLICTDVAARGLDFPSVTLIVQYDAPCEASDYIHRVGRTARMGAQGEAILFLEQAEEPYLKILESKGLINMQKMNFQRIIQHWNPDLPLQKCIAQLDGKIAALVKDDLEEKAKVAFSSTVRAYGSHCKEEKDCFAIGKLHLGHLAKSFGLLNAPSGISKGIGRKRAKANEATSEKQPKKHRVKVGEFDSGL